MRGTYLRKWGVPTYFRGAYLRRRGVPTYRFSGTLPTFGGPTYENGEYLPTDIGGAYLLSGLSLFFTTNLVSAEKHRLMKATWARKTVETNV